MKMLTMLGGELSNSATFANVSTKDCTDLRGTLLPSLLFQRGLEGNFHMNKKANPTRCTKR